MQKEKQTVKRILGLVKKRLPDLKLTRISDPRRKQGRKWKKLPYLLRNCIIGICAGVESFSEPRRMD